MNKRIIKSVSFILCAVLLLLTTACENQKEVYIGNASNLNETLYICSDLHLLSNNVIDPTTSKNTRDGRFQEHDYDLANALVSKVNQDKPTALILTGDLSFNGEKDSHAELVKILDKVDPEVKVLVIPGNHDTYMMDGLVENFSTTYETFRDLYTNYGYTGAISYDTNTLSYAYEINDKLIALMLDTTLNRYNEEDNRNIIGGFIEAPTLEWMESVLSQAKTKGQRVISFTHHNVIDHDTGFTSGYTLIDNETVINLLTKYGVKLNFSGHLHIQNIAEAEANGVKLYDVASSSLLTYSNTVGSLKLYSDGFEYSKESLVPFDGFTELSRQHFIDTNYNRSLARYQTNYPDNYEELLSFTENCNVLYFDGDYNAINELLRENKKLLKIIKKNSDGVLTHYFRVPDIDQRVLSGRW